MQCVGVDGRISFDENGNRRSQFSVMDYTNEDGSERTVGLIDLTKPNDSVSSISISL